VIPRERRTYLFSATMTKKVLSSRNVGLFHWSFSVSAGGGASVSPAAIFRVLFLIPVKTSAVHIHTHLYRHASYFLHLQLSRRKQLTLYSSPALWPVLQVIQEHQQADTRAVHHFRVDTLFSRADVFSCGFRSKSYREQL